jgi:hypothetical protein
LIGLIHSPPLATAAGFQKPDRTKDLIMKKLLTLTGVLAVALNLIAAPEEYVTKSASGSTSATVYFEPGSQAAALVVADVTSDKAASVLSWRIGTNQVTLLTGAAADVTNMLTTVGNIASNAALVSVTSAGVVTAHTAFTNSYLTNATITLENNLTTNLTTAAIAKKLTGESIAITGTLYTNVVIIASNATVVAVGTNFLFQGAGWQVETNQVKSWITNGTSYQVTLSNNFSFIPARALVMTNTYPVMFTASETATSLVLSNSTELAAGDNLVILPSTLGAKVLQIQTISALRYQYQNIKAVTGLALAAGDRLFVLDTAVTTPVGAATLRLMADPVRILPANVPGVLSVDGTSACAVNAAVVRYR